MRQPIIFIGMHRSGTSMLGRLLEDLGLFAGIRKDDNNEAIFFKELNEWLMAQCGARWDMPGAIQYLRGNEKVLTYISDYISYLLDSPRAIQFLGIRRYLSTHGITKQKVPWGWKDPRNTFTLPVWLRIFPEAKVIYIERHGVDVAKSLYVRSQKGFVNTSRKYMKYRFIVPFRPKRGGFIESPRCASLEGGFSLWQMYVAQAQVVMEKLKKHQLLRLRYEEVLENPMSSLSQCVDFCGLDVSKQQLKTVIADINVSRAYSYLKEQELRDFARKHEADLAERDYT